MTKGFAPHHRKSAAARWLVTAACRALGLSVLLWHAAIGRAEPAAKLDAVYTASLLGLPIGHVSWTIDIRGGQFYAEASGGTSGLLQIFSPGHGIAKSDGVLLDEQLVASNFMVNLIHGNTSEVIKILFKDGKARELLDPPPKPDPYAVPLTDASRIGVLDPMTAMIVSVPGKGDIAAPAACDHKIAVFDGHVRFDVQLAYKRLEQVRAEAGYRGPAVVCAMYFMPLAGYDPSRTAIKYMQAERGMEMWLAPLAGARLMAPFRISVPTPLGLGVLQATRFIWTRQHGGAGPLHAD